MSRSAALLALLPLLAATPDQTYDLKFSWKPVAGAKVEVRESELQNVDVTVKQADTVLQSQKQKKGKTFEGRVEVLKVEGDKVAEALMTWSKASRLEEGRDVAYGFEGKAVRMKRKDGKVEFAREDGAKLEDAEVEALKDAMEDMDRAPGEPTVEEVLSPKKPVKVGESWSPDIKVLSSNMFKEMGDAIDTDKSKVVLTLKSVEKRDGKDFGTVEGVFDLVLSKMGPLELEKPMKLKLTAELVAAVDGSAPDGHMKMKAEMKDSSPVTGPDGTKITFEIEIGGDMSKSRKAVR